MRTPVQDRNKLEENNPKEELKKPGFISSFWESCTNLNFYPKATKASWWHATFHAFVLLAFLAGACSYATYPALVKNLENMLADIPVVEVKDGKANFDPNLKLPWRKSFPDKGKKRLQYIIDSGENVQALEEKYPMYVIFTPNEMIFNDGQQRQELPIKTIKGDGPTIQGLEDSTFIKQVFGDPITFSPSTIAGFAAKVALLFTGLVFFVIVLVFFPLTNLLIALIASVADRWNVTFSNIVKLSVFAATPAILIFSFGCFLLNGFALLLTLAIVAGIVQTAYLITGLKACKEVLA